MNEKAFYIRQAEEKDVPVILEFIRRLAEYENMTNDVTATEDLLKEWIFEKKIANVLFAVADKKEVGFALYFYNFSTFLGKGGLYLEDLFVLSEYRGKGIAKALLSEIAAKTLGIGGGRLEWQCLDWNKPAINFYTSLNAVPLNEWITFRLTGSALKNMAKGNCKTNDSML